MWRNAPGGTGWLASRSNGTGAREKSYWLVLERPEVSVCWTDPGFEPDLFVTADTVALHRIWVGQLPLAPALRDGLIDVDGPDELRRAFPDWLKLSVSPACVKLPASATA